MDNKHKKMKWFVRWDLNEKGRCEHVKDILEDAEPIGVIELDGDKRWEIFSCRTCGYIYCGRLPLKYFLMAEKKYCDMKKEISKSLGES